MTKADRARIVFLADDYAGYESRGLLGQHGISVFIEVEKNGKKSHILFDTAQYAEGVIHNANILGIDLKNIGVIVLSHNHYDHTGGLYGIIKHINRRIPVVAHPDIFKPSISIGEDNVRLNIGVPESREKLEAAGANFILTRSPLEVAPGVYFLGEIPREWPHLSPGLEGNYTIENGELVKHELRDDTGIAIVVDGFGAIVIGGCSHSGIANIVKHAESVVKETPMVVMGGFHMISAPQDLISETIEKFKELGVREVHAGHCTGLRAEYLFMEEYGSNFKLLHSGHLTVY